MVARSGMGVTNLPVSGPVGFPAPRNSTRRPLAARWAYHDRRHTARGAVGPVMVSDAVDSFTYAFDENLVVLYLVVLVGGVGSLHYVVSDVTGQ
jgi:hypothetical protein